jgi:uncharacterized protein (DUF342 family)
MGEAALASCEDVATIRLVLPNLHHTLADLTPFGLDNPNAVFVPSSESRGVIEAEQKVEAAYVGNAGEKRTQIIVSGFNRNSVKADIEKLQLKLEEAKSGLAKAKQLFAIFSQGLEADPSQFRESAAAKERYFEAKDKVRLLEIEIKALLKCFKVKGEGEVNITKRVYPNTMIELKGMIEEIRQESYGNCFVILDNEIRKM